MVGIDKVLNYCRDRPDRTSRNDDNYQDNRFFDLKIHYFYALDRDVNRPLVLWGAGRKGKDYSSTFAKAEKIRASIGYAIILGKIGREIYGIELKSTGDDFRIGPPANSSSGNFARSATAIQKQLTSWEKAASAGLLVFCVISRLSAFPGFQHSLHQPQHANLASHSWALPLLSPFTPGIGSVKQSLSSRDGYLLRRAQPNRSGDCRVDAADKYFY